MRQDGDLTRAHQLHLRDLQLLEQLLELRSRREGGGTKQRKSERDKKSTSSELQQQHSSPIKRASEQQLQLQRGKH